MKAKEYLLNEKNNNFAGKTTTEQKKKIQDINVFKFNLSVFAVVLIDQNVLLYDEFCSDS